MCDSRPCICVLSTSAHGCLTSQDTWHLFVQAAWGAAGVPSAGVVSADAGPRRRHGRAWQHSCSSFAMAGSRANAANFAAKEPAGRL